MNGKHDLAGVFFFILVKETSAKQGTVFTVHIMMTGDNNTFDSLPSKTTKLIRVCFEKAIFKY